MEIDYTLYVLAAFRACIVGFGLYFVGKFLNAHPPKTGFFKKTWEKDKRVREWMIKHAFIIGFISFFVFVALAKTIPWWR